MREIRDGLIMSQIKQIEDGLVAETSFKYLKSIYA